jgi:hypothetical protein
MNITWDEHHISPGRMEKHGTKECYRAWVGHGEMHLLVFTMPDDPIWYAAANGTGAGHFKTIEEAKAGAIAYAIKIARDILADCESDQTLAGIGAAGEGM